MSSNDDKYGQASGYSSPGGDSSYAWSAMQATPETRVEFLHKTYQHLALAIAAFIGLEALLLNIPEVVAVSETLARGWSWLGVLLVFGVVSNVAQNWAMNGANTNKAYMGLMLYVLLEALLFVPLMSVAMRIGGPDVVMRAGWYTALVFFGLTAFVLMSKKDFSFLGGILSLAFWVALATIVVGVLFGFNLGTWFAGAMVLFAGGSIVYQTSNVLHHFRPGQHVAASLSLFASVALLFWYVLQIVMQTSDD